MASAFLWKIGFNYVKPGKYECIAIIFPAFNWLALYWFGRKIIIRQKKRSTNILRIGGPEHYRLWAFAIHPTYWPAESL
jgi:hypothetical protein